MTRAVKNGKVAFKGGQCGRMDRVARYLHTQRRTTKIKKEDKALLRRTKRRRLVNVKFSIWRLFKFK